MCVYICMFVYHCVGVGGRGMCRCVCVCVWGGGGGAGFMYFCVLCVCCTSECCTVCSVCSVPYPRIKIVTAWCVQIPSLPVLIACIPGMPWLTMEGNTSSLPLDRYSSWFEEHPYLRTFFGQEVGVVQC